MAETEQITADERRTLSVLAFLFYRMGLEDRARRVYAAIAELSEPGSADYRFAKAGLAAVAVESGNGAEALAEMAAGHGRMGRTYAGEDYGAGGVQAVSGARVAWHFQKH